MPDRIYRVVRNGASLQVTISADLVRKLKLEAGTPVVWKPDGTLVPLKVRA